VTSRHRPLRDHLLFYGVLAAIVVVFAALTGGPIVKAIVIAAVCFVLASAWTAWRGRRQPHEGER
jgi:membrane protein implicated in regulation of membrane protease activity